MCGICGIYDRQKCLYPIEAMCKSLRHRGPDDEGYLFINSDSGAWQETGGENTSLSLLSATRQSHLRENDIAFGSRRLAIQDLSPAGHMPMSYAEQNLWITYNGEIYNFIELRKQLQALGHRFASGSDCEVILAAYCEWGTSCLQYLNGMFAFAIWDNLNKRLFCARDRFGIKPFYYFWNSERFVFASELKAFRHHDKVPHTPNDQAIFDYLARGLSDHDSDTMYATIKTLPAAHFLLLDIQSNQLSLHNWWQVQINDSISDSAINQRHVEEFSNLLEDAIRIRLRSDVPVGSCLSGGLDSSSIVCLANTLLMEEDVIPRELVGNHQKTFTARNRDASIDEHPFSSLVIEATGAEENLVYPSGTKLWQELDAFVEALDQPVDSTSQYLQWAVMRLASERGVTVLLDGQGGDEILAGYYAYYPTYVQQIWQETGPLNALKASLALSNVNGRPARDKLLSEALHHLPWRIRRLINKVWQEQPAPGQGGTGLEGWQINQDFQQQFHDRRWQPTTQSESGGLAALLHKDLTETNLPKLLRYEDRNSMAFSLETRLPFLDYRLVEQVFSLPLNYRLNQGWSKWLLRKAMDKKIPPAIQWRRSKLGFPTPEKAWLQEGNSVIRSRLQNGLESDKLTNYVCPDALQQILALPDAELTAVPGLWRITNLAVWLEQFE